MTTQQLPQPITAFYLMSPYIRGEETGRVAVRYARHLGYGADKFRLEGKTDVSQAIRLEDLGVTGCTETGALWAIIQREIDSFEQNIDQVECVYLASNLFNLLRS